MGALRTTEARILRWARSLVGLVVIWFIPAFVAPLAVAVIWSWWPTREFSMSAEFLRATWPFFVVIFGCIVTSIAWGRALFGYHAHLRLQRGEKGLVVYLDPQATQLCVDGEFRLGGWIASWKPETVNVDRIELFAAFLNGVRVHDVHAQEPAGMTLHAGDHPTAWSTTKTGLQIQEEPGVVGLSGVHVRIHADCGDGERIFDFKQLQTTCWLLPEVPVEDDVPPDSIDESAADDDSSSPERHLRDEEPEES